MRSWTPFGSVRRMSSTALADASGDGHGIRAELLDDAGADDLALEPVRDAAPDRRGLANVGDVAEQDGHVPPRRDHGAPQVVDALRATERAHRPFDRALGDDAARRVHVRFLDGVHHLVQADASRRHAFGIELHLKLPEIAAQPFHGRDTGHGQQSVVDLELREVPQRHEIRRAWIGFERELEDLVEPAGEAGNQRRIGAGGKLPGDLRDPLGDELPRAVVVGVRVELDRDLCDTQLGIRSHPANVGQPCERHFERNRDRRFQFLGAHRRVLRDDVEDRRGQIGKHIPSKILHPERADRRAGGDQQHGQERRVKRLANQSANHGAPQWASCSPSPFSAWALSRNAPSTTIVSPARSPERTSTSPPRSRPRPMRRISKWFASLGRNTHHSLRTR